MDKYVAWKNSRPRYRTAVIFIEENPTYIETVRPFFEAMDRGTFLVVTNDIQLPDIPSIQILSLDSLR